MKLNTEYIVLQHVRKGSIIKIPIQFPGACWAATSNSVVPWGGAAFNATQFSRQELLTNIADI